MSVTAWARVRAKIILSGEHFVVFGEPVIVMAMNQRAHSKVALREDKRIHVGPAPSEESPRQSRRRTLYVEKSGEGVGIEG